MDASTGLPWDGTDLLHWVAEPAPSMAAVSGAKGVDPAALHREAIGALGARPQEPVALALRVPFCAVRCLFCERDVRAAQLPAAIGEYVDRLIDEVGDVARAAGGGRDVAQLHLGGGSVSELGEGQLRRLMHEVQAHWRVPADAELSAECDPRRTGWSQLELLRELGFARVRFGVIDFDVQVQHAVGRCQSGALVEDVCGVARSCGIENIGFDLMVGLPHQTADGWRTTLQRVIELAPDRIAVGRDRHRPRLAPGQFAIDASGLPSAAERDALAESGARLLAEVGYWWAGVGLFVLDGDELAWAGEQGRLRRSLIAYTGAPPCPSLGHRVGAISEVDGHRFRHHPSVKGWLDAMRAGQSPVVGAWPASPQLRDWRDAIEQQLCRQELARETADDGFERALARLAPAGREGWVELRDDRIVVSDLGRPRLATLCELLQAPLGAGPRLHS